MPRTETHQSTTRLTVIDKALAVTVLKLIPRAVTPNQVTVFRFCTIPFVFWLFFSHNYQAGVTLFLFSAFTDAVDGALARTRDQITAWGTKYDPLADKLLIAMGTAPIVIAYLRLWVAISILGVEVVLVGGYLLLKQWVSIEIKPNAWGKTKMLFQSIGISLLLLYAFSSISLLLEIATIILFCSVLLGVASLIAYAVRLKLFLFFASAVR